jgi:hypothetical protein
MAFTREDIERWTPDHLQEAATYINNQHPRWTDHYSAMELQLSNLGWRGLAADKAIEQAYHDYITALTASTPAQIAAITLTTAAGDLTAGQQLILRLIDAAEKEPPPVGGFTVSINDGVTVDDAVFQKGYPSKAIEESRKAQALGHAMDIASAIHSWQGLKTATSAQLQAQAEALRMVQFSSGEPVSGGAQERA